MTETFARIRWEDKTPGHGDVYNVASIGYAGTVGESAFIIYTPDEAHDGWLLSVRLTPGGQFLYGASQDEMKRAAEDWLAGFVSSLGAVFPEEPGTMFADVTDEEAFEEAFRAQFAPGRRVRFAHPDAGYPADQRMAASLLTSGEVYVIAWSDIGFSSSRLGLAGIEDRAQGFNSVLFEPADDETSATEAGEKE